MQYTVHKYTVLFKDAIRDEYTIYIIAVYLLLKKYKYLPILKRNCPEMQQLQNAIFQEAVHGRFGIVYQSRIAFKFFERHILHCQYNEIIVMQ